MKPLTRSYKVRESDYEIVNKYFKENSDEEIWLNNIYQVNVRRGLPCHGMKDEDGNPLLITHLSIKRIDRSAKIDWRDFQYIKNQLVGDENEGCDIYPAESRLVDGANSFHIWCFENKEVRFPFGFNERMVTESIGIGEKQRPFPYNRKPQDLKECEEKAKKQIQEMLNK